MELFQVSLIGFQKFFLFWVAGIILEAWDEELESAHFFAVIPSEKNSVLYLQYFWFGLIFQYLFEVDSEIKWN